MSKSKKKVRNYEAIEMMLTCKGGPHRDRRDKRASNKKNDWAADIEDELDTSVDDIVNQFED